MASSSNNMGGSSMGGNPAPATSSSSGPAGSSRLPLPVLSSSPVSASNASSSVEATAARLRTSKIESPRPPLWTISVAGGIGGGVADMALHNLDTVKTRLQSEYPFKQRYQTTWNAYLVILREEGVLRGLHSGGLATFVGSVPSTMVYFASYESMKLFLYKNTQISPPIVHLTAAGLSDVLAAFVYVPFEVIKTRLQLQGKHNNAFQLTPYNYRGIIDAGRSLYREGGVRLLLRGFGATVLRDAPFSAVQFCIYEQLKSLILSTRRAKLAPFYPITATSSTAAIPHHHQSLTGTESFTAGALAGAAAGVLTNWMDVAKTRLQTTHDHASYKGIVKALGMVIKTDGFRGLMRGWGPRSMWTAFQSSLLFFVYEEVLNMLVEGYVREGDDSYH